MLKRVPVAVKIAGGAVLVVGAIVSVTYEDHRATDKYQRVCQEQVSKVPPGSGKEDAASAKKCDDPKDYMPWWYKLVAWPDGIGGWALIATGFVIAWQSWETRSAAKATRDAIILQYRPRIKIRSIRIVALDDPNGFEIRLTIRNGGETVAYIRETTLDIDWMKEGNSTDTRKYVIRPLQLSPGEATTFPISVAEFNIKFAASRLILTENPSQQQTACLSISGSFIYTDEIGTRRETTLIRLYDFKAEEFLVHDAEGEYSD